MKLLKILPVIVLFSCMTNKNVERTITIKPIGWQFPLPTETDLRDSAFNFTGEVVDQIPANGPSLRLFTIKDSPFGSFSAYLRKDTLKYNDWKEWHDQDTKWYFEQLRQLPQIQLLETRSYTTAFDSIIFLVQYSKFTKGRADTFYVYHHYGRINGIELDISFEYNNPLTGKKYKNIIDKSKFVE